MSINGIEVAAGKPRSWARHAVADEIEREGAVGDRYDRGEDSSL
jgi:hypothetical protein